MLSAAFQTKYAWYDFPKTKNAVQVSINNSSRQD